MIKKHSFAYNQAHSSTTPLLKSIYLDSEMD